MYRGYNSGLPSSTSGVRRPMNGDCDKERVSAVCTIENWPYALGKTHSGLDKSSDMRPEAHLPLTTLLLR